jgi:hypothetical protein
VPTTSRSRGGTPNAARFNRAATSSRPRTRTASPASRATSTG